MLRFQSSKSFLGDTFAFFFLVICIFRSVELFMILLTLAFGANFRIAVKMLNYDKQQLSLFNKHNRKMSQSNWITTKGLYSYQADSFWSIFLLFVIAICIYSIDCYELLLKWTFKWALFHNVSCTINNNFTHQISQFSPWTVNLTHTKQK